MFDTIVLLSGQAEEPALAATLRRHHPRLAIRAVHSFEELDAIEEKTLRRARLIGFTTPVVVPGRILAQLGYGAYNFHPGPPSYPGWTPSHFAVYDGARYFGATAHTMVEKVDAGPIVGVELFDVQPGVTVRELDELAVVQLCKLFWRLAAALATQSEPLPHLPVQWSGRLRSRRMRTSLCDIPPDVSQDELQRRIDAFAVGAINDSPTVTLHGHRFYYVRPAAEVRVESPSLVPEQRALEAAE